MKIVDQAISSTLLRVFPKWITPNQITWVRFILTPVVFFCLYEKFLLVGVILLIIATFSDAVDGALARTRAQITDWGTLYDPLADKILITGTALIVLPRIIGWPIPIIVLVLELGIMIEAWYRNKKNGVIVPSQWEGKLKMVLQSLAVILAIIFIFHPFHWLLITIKIFLWAAILLACLSYFVYRTI